MSRIPIAIVCCPIAIALLVSSCDQRDLTKCQYPNFDQIAADLKPGTSLETSLAYLKEHGVTVSIGEGDHPDMSPNEVGKNGSGRYKPVSVVSSYDIPEY